MPLELEEGTWVPAEPLNSCMTLGLSPLPFAPCPFPPVTFPPALVCMCKQLSALGLL